MAAIKVQGMTCQHCVQAVTQALSGNISDLPEANLNTLSLV
jgi:hypothetical protein